MKLHAINEGKQRRKISSKIAPLVALTLIITILPIYYPYIFNILEKPIEISSSEDDLLDVQTTTTLSDHHPPYCNHLLPPGERKKEGDGDDLKVVVVPEKKESRKSGRRRRRRKKRKRGWGEVVLTRTGGGGGGEIKNLDEGGGGGGGGGEIKNLYDGGGGSGEIKNLDGAGGGGEIKNLDGGGGGNGSSCDLFSGEWVENPEGPYYTNASCYAIQEHQNCMKYGRPDRDFLKWRWKPHGCELPIFDPSKFLEMMRGKSLAFVGDSIARNHMQSLLCLLSRVAYPNDVSNSDDLNFRHWKYPGYDFNISIFWSPYLVNTERINKKDVTQPFKLYLDELDESWTSQIENFNYVVISAGQWFFRPTIFYSNRRVIGCLYCPESTIHHRSSTFSYRRAWRTTFKAINGLKNFKGIVFMRSFAPSHFEGGGWDKGGDCVRTKPFKNNESVMEDYSLEMYKTQLQEYIIGEREGRRKGIKITLIDVTQVMQLRPDGHPGRYDHWPLQNVAMPNDCVHWCLPGPIDAWNDLLMELIGRECNR
ncbi:hypothetical protein L6452_44414 [Arctium lappa]|uniref:Uncharacterized protein n=1 Tax=Arctium lappa TaxID=4217 RepID=A0ACB8XFU2_ARCLA|nr:hypothetical protein L6452_44414 [Arctium lappa]